MLSQGRNDLQRLDRALLGLRRFFTIPRAVDDEGRRVEVSTLLVLDALGGGEASVGEVAERLDVAHSTASRLVTRAEQAGVVERRRSGRDARQTTIAMTPAGAALERRATAFRLDRLERLTEGWRADEVGDLATGLGRLAARVAEESPADPR